MAQPMVQMSQALVASAAQTQTMLAQGVGRLPVLKLDGRSRPKVKAVKVWIKDLVDKRFSGLPRIRSNTGIAEEDSHHSGEGRLRCALYLRAG